MPTNKKKVSKKKIKSSRSKNKNGSKKKQKKITKTKSKGTKRTKGTKGTKGTKARGTKTKRTYKTQIQLDSDNKGLNEKCKKHNGKSKDCRSTRTADGRPECWYNYDTKLCTGFVPKKRN